MQTGQQFPHGNWGNRGDNGDSVEVDKVLDLWVEETVQFSIDYKKLRKRKPREAIYHTLQVQLE